MNYGHLKGRSGRFRPDTLYTSVYVDLPAITRSMIIPRTRLAKDAVTTPHNVRNIALSRDSLM